MKKTVNVVFILICTLMIAFLSSAGILSRGGEYSLTENRMLDSEPAPTAENISDGSWFAQYEEWLKDAVPWRSQLIGLYTGIALDVQRRPVVNGIYSADGVLLPYLTPISVPDDGQISAVVTPLEELNDALGEYGGKLCYIGLEGQITAFADKYPDWLCSRREYYDALYRDFPAELASAGIDFVPGNKLVGADDYMRSDHHLSLSGAYKVYLEICRYCGVSPVTGADGLEFSTLPNTFYGSRGRSLNGLSDITDRLDIYTLPDAPAFARFDFEAAVAPTVFSLPVNNDMPVTYELYMGGDIGECRIETNRPELPDVLIFGDSYTNSVECFAALSFDTMYSIDLRYTSRSLIQYVRMCSPDYVFCIRDDGAWLETAGNGNIY